MIERSNTAYMYVCIAQKKLITVELRSKGCHGTGPIFPID